LACLDEHVTWGREGGLLSPAESSLLIDQYELSMAASYLERGRNEEAVFELFVRSLPPERQWLLVAGLGPALEWLYELRFGDAELRYLESLGFGARLLRYLERFRFGGDVDAMPEGTVAFANEPLVRVSAPRVEAQLIETLLLNQLDFQTKAATSAARLALAAGGGEVGAGGRIADFSARRDPGMDAAMQVARAAAIAGIVGTSNMAAAMRLGLRPAGTMAHSYVLSHASELEAFTAFLEDVPDNAVLLVDTYDTLAGVRNAVAASRQTGVPLMGVRIDSGDLLALARGARAELDAAGMRRAAIVASGELDEWRIAELVGEGAPIDLYGVGTALGVSPDAPPLGAVYKLVADEAPGGGWHGVFKHSPEKATVPGPKQVFRSFSAGVMSGDVIAHVDERRPGAALLERFLERGQPMREDSLAQMTARARESIAALPAPLRRVGTLSPPQEGYRVDYSARLREAR
jgi:nicotinate phosphoribosyltransferase